MASCGKAEVSSGEILVIGDSLSSAHGMPADQGWVQLLQARLIDKGFDYSVNNISSGGATSREGLGQLRKVLPGLQPTVAIIAIGGNDGLRGQPLHALKANLRKMIDMLSDAGARVVLLPMHIPDNYGAAYTGKFNAVYHELIGEYELPQAPFLLNQVHDQPGMMQADGIHPTVAAQGRILDNIWPTLEMVL